MKKQHVYGFLFALFLAVSAFNDVVAINYYSDPVSGSMSNNGTFEKPWAGLNAIFSANKKFAAGDTLFLRSGRHAYTVIRGLNTGYVVIMPQPGESPVVDRIRFSSASSTAASYWRIYGLIIQSESTGTAGTPSHNLVEVYRYASNITIANCTITSNLNTTNWTRDDWRLRCAGGIMTQGLLNSGDIIENNLIINTAFSLSVSSSNTIVRANTIKNFTNDGCRILGSDILFENNRVFDLIKVMNNSENHDDMFQAFAYPAGGTGQDTLKNNIIRRNLMVSTTNTNRPFVGPAQGIGCFDGPLVNWLIENNIIVADQFHGISLYGASDCKVLNNTVIDPYDITPYDPIDNNSQDIGPTWILIAEKSNGPKSSNNYVANNLVQNRVIITTKSMGSESNNTIVGSTYSYNDYFVNASDLSSPGTFDLHLKLGSPAIGVGEKSVAPLYDFDGFPRANSNRVDAGAYEYNPNLSVEKLFIKQNGFKIYPNPFRNEFKIELTENLSKSVKIEILNLNGQVILSENRVPNSTTLQIRSLTNLANGTYFLKLTDEFGNISQKKISKAP